MQEQLERLIEQMVDSGAFFGDAVSAFKEGYLKKVLETNRGNQSVAAKALGIHRNTLCRKMEEYKLNGRAATTPPSWQRTIRETAPGKIVKHPVLRQERKDQRPQGRERIRG